MRAVFLLLTAALATALGLVFPASAAEHTVAQGESISAVLERVSPGDTVRLIGTEYRENLVIDVPIVLIGVGMPVIRGGYEGNVVHVTAPGTVLEGLHISEASPRLTQDMACLLIEADDVTVRDSVISEPLHGIYVKGGQRTLIVGNRIQGRVDLEESDRGNGIHLWNTSDNRIEENEVHVHDARYGLHYMYSNHNSFSDNLFESNVAGAALMYSEEILFSGNTFARCRGYRAYGILLQSMKDVTARSNLILDNSRGIFLNNSDDNLFDSNDVVDNDLAIQLNGGCDGNRFVANNFLDNLSELLLDVSDLGTEWTDGTGGNHWSRYRGYDLARDGVGDVPFSIQNVFQVIEADVPEVRFYVLSPAAEILVAAERALPILKLGEAQDRLPLIRAVANDEVPWEAAGVVGQRPSPAWAGLYLTVALAFPGALIFLSRLRRRTERRR
jgi:nitrous oxidase accessory protein